MNYTKTFKPKSWPMRIKSVLWELKTLLSVCLIILPICALSFDELLIERSIAFAAFALWFTYVIKTPFQAAESGLENEQMTIDRCSRYVHSFYRVAQSALTLYAIYRAITYIM